VSETFTHLLNSFSVVGFVKSNGVVVDTEPPPRRLTVAVTERADPSGRDAL